MARWLLHRWRYSPTVAYGNNEVHLHLYLARRISVAEALAIQSLPKEYVINKALCKSAKNEFCRGENDDIFHEYWKNFRNSYKTRFKNTYQHLYNELYRGYINERNIMEVDGCRKQWNETASVSKKKLHSELYFKHEISYSIYRNWEDFEDYNIQNLRKIKKEI